MEKIDEYAAWCEIAMLCESVEDPSHDDPPYGDGLCEMIDNLQYTSHCLYETMIGRIDDYKWNVRKRFLIGYWWPQTKKGWECRARFAWNMAEKCIMEMERDDA